MKHRAADNFENYFTAKLWNMIPAIYRYEDARINLPFNTGSASSYGPLQELVKILSKQAAELRRSHDRLWEDQFIEFCNDWAIPYIGDLLGTRLVSVLNNRARRVDVAKTIYYRRRKGTLRVLEELISDVTNWEGTVVENFRRLARMRHLIDPHPEHFKGRISSTPPGGLANLRKIEMHDLCRTAFDEFHYTPDVRGFDGLKGRYAISKLAFHVYSLKVFLVENANPYKFSQAEPYGVKNIYSFDPSGRQIPLFRSRNRSQDSKKWLDSRKETGENWNSWELAQEWELPDKIRCGLLNTIIEKDRLPLSLWLQVTGKPFNPVAGDVSNKDQLATNNDVLIDPEKGLFTFKTAVKKAKQVSYCYGFSGDIGAGTYDRRGVLNHMIRRFKCLEVFQNVEPESIKDGENVLKIPALGKANILEIPDSATYPLAKEIKNVENVIIRSTNKCRPYIKLDSSLIINTNGNKNSVVILDGLWIGSERNLSLVLKGNYECVILKHCTIDPGGKYAGANNPPTYIPAIPLVVKGYVEKLIVEDAIIGPLRTEDQGFIEELHISDSIVQGKGDAINLSDGTVCLKATTVLGGIRVHQLYATDSIINGIVQVTNIQNGCFRFSAAEKGSVVPKPYRYFEIPSGTAIFESIEFGAPEFARLKYTISDQVLKGAENNLEMGAFNKLLNPVKLDSLSAKVNEYMPFGLIPIFIFEK
jgi:hypothetical protein